MPFDCFQCYHSLFPQFHYNSPHHSLHPYRSACGIGCASENHLNAGQFSQLSIQQLVHGQTMNSFRIMVKCMQASVFPPEIQYFKQLKLVFLNVLIMRGSWLSLNPVTYSDYSSQLCTQTCSQNLTLKIYVYYIIYMCVCACACACVCVCVCRYICI